MTGNQRRKQFVDAKVQGALVRRFLLHWLLFVFASFVLLCIWQVLVSGDPLGGFGAAMQTVWTQNLPVFVVVVLLLPVFVLDTVKLSNRFAGPIVRLREGLREWADDEEVRPIQLRKNDFWHDLADLFNRATQQDAQPQSQSAADRPKAETEPVEVGA